MRSGGRRKGEMEITEIKTRRGHGEAGHRSLRRKIGANSLQRLNHPANQPPGPPAPPPTTLSLSVCIGFRSGFRCVSIFHSLAKQQQNNIVFISYFFSSSILLLPFPTSDSLPLYRDLFLPKTNAVLHEHNPVKSKKKNNARKRCGP